ncbi:hypothetical protein [Ferruginibacter sp. HRS2-29]|uniref:hypothetical protein n=1 Tax=Ferruginibacter sp. HRS2-29 TaxID=2487334 RepID=UPI0020CC3465|nr:hypothetical protein [Ferruginibacter sp. HRS2-29]MCP9750447.1 hypothetical protein [Ferruginibacter sp. HRS2-29]
MTLKQIERAGIDAVKMLRRTKLSGGLPFMINSDLLPPEQCYLEYPDGSIKTVVISKYDNDFKVIEELSAERIAYIRNKYELF